MFRTPPFHLRKRRYVREFILIQAESSASAKGHWTLFEFNFILGVKGFFSFQVFFSLFFNHKMQPRHLYLQLNSRSFKVHNHNTNCRKRKLWGRVWQRTNSTFESNIRLSISHFLLFVGYSERCKQDNLTVSFWSYVKLIKQSNNQGLIKQYGIVVCVNLTFKLFKPSSER